MKSEINKKISKNIGYLLEIGLALEDYADDTEDTSIYQFDCFKLLNDLYKNRNSYPEKEQLEKTETALKLFNELLDKIGRDKFTFYKDGGIEYVWKFKGKN